jgi:predicted ferric reductase
MLPEYSVSEKISAGLVGVSADPKLSWYLTRSFGLVLLVLFTATTALGILSSTAESGGRVPRFVATELHRRLSVISVLLLAGHIVASVADNYVVITWTDAVVPFAGSYRPLWLGLGTLACDVILLVVLTSFLRHRMRPGLWRGIHLAVYAAWPVVVLHGLGTGYDARSTPVLLLTLACTGLVLGAVAWRLMLLPGPTRGLRLATVVLLPVLPLVSEL